MIALSFSTRVGRRACAGKMLINHLVGWPVRVLISCSNPYQSVVVELMKGGTNTRETTNYGLAVGATNLFPRCLTALWIRA
jgi:hypothetical protein